MISFPPQKIGSLGERKFEDLCERADLVVSKPMPDSTGKDRLVEFPFVTPSGSESYDNRPAPLACCVQVKTMLAKNDSCELSLTNAERLARDNRPAFVAILRIDDAGEFVDMYLLHVDNDVLAKILKRLRKEHAKGTIRLNHESIELSINAAEKINLNPDSLRKALEIAIGADMFAYADRKRIQLKELGYDDYRHEIKIALCPTNIDQVLEAFLGLRDLPVEKFECFERRFGIALPAQPTQSEGVNHIFRVQPPSAGRCTVQVEDALNRQKAVVEGVAYFAEVPRTDSKYRMLLLKTGLIDFILRDKAATLMFNEKHEGGNRHKLQVLRQNCEVLKLLSRSACTITIRLIEAQNEIELNNCCFKDSEQYGWVDHLLKVVEAADELRHLACAEDEPIDLDRLSLEEREILQANTLMSGATDRLFIELAPDTKPKGLKLQEEPVIVISPVIIGDEPYAYAVRGTLSNDLGENNAKWVVTQVEPLVIERLGTNPRECYRFFTEKLVRLCGISNVIQRHLVDNDVEQNEDLPRPAE